MSPKQPSSQPTSCLQISPLLRIHQSNLVRNHRRFPQGIYYQPRGKKPTLQPSRQPSRLPSEQPVSQPTNQSMNFPTVQPSSNPSMRPSSLPSIQPNLERNQAHYRVHNHDFVSHQGSLVLLSHPARLPDHSHPQPSHQPSSQPSSKPTRQPKQNPMLVHSQSSSFESF